jgi:signal transduction histidine kinase
MRKIVQLARRPVLIIWSLATLAIGIAMATLPRLPATLQDWIGAVLIAALIGVGDWFAVTLDEGDALSPAPALLIAGLSAAGWTLLALAVLVGTLAPIAVRVFDEWVFIHYQDARSSRRQAAKSLPTMLRLRGLLRDLAEYVVQVAQELNYRELGARVLIVGMLAPLYPLLEARLAAPYSTPIGLIGLLCMGALVYTVALATGAPSADTTTLLARWRGPRRWYALAMIPLGGLLGVLWSNSPWALLLGLAPLAVTQHAFRDQVALRQTTADFAHLAVQRESLTTRIERLQALATTMIGTLDVQAMLELLRERLAALLDADYGWVVLREEDGRARLSVGRRQALTGTQSLELVAPENYTALFERGMVVLIADDDRLAALAPAASDPAVWSTMLGIPLIGEQGVLGMICLAFERLRGLDGDEQRVLTSFARQAATVIENARLFDELHRKQAELIQSSKLAAVGTFAAGIAHEFNNLLAGMLGHAEIGYRLDDPEEKNHSLDIVIQSCRRGRSITQGLLTFARRRDHKRQLADVMTAIDETLMLVELDLQKSQIEVVRDLDLVPPTVCDLGQISQVVLNLVTNARDAMKPHGGTLTVGLCERDGVIEISVADTGSGIPEELRDKIFEPFVTTKGALGGSQTPGTGLGLSVSYGIVHHHGGEILVDSEVGRGTTMTVRLPVIAEGVEEVVAIGEF